MTNNDRELAATALDEYARRIMTQGTDPAARTCWVHRADRARDLAWRLRYLEVEAPARSS